MVKIYLVRHAESIANTRGIYQGQTYDTPLSPLGIRQAEALSQYMIEFQLDYIISSPLNRTCQTAQKAAEKHRKQVRKEIRIIETNHGLWEGLSKQDIKSRWPDVYEKWINFPFDTCFPQGESFMQTAERVMVWWNKLKKPDKNILVVTHDNIIRIILSEILNTRDIWSIDLSPAGVTEVEITGKEAVLNVLNEVRHLEGLASDLAIHAL